MTNIKEVLVRGKEIIVHYKSETYRCYMKKEDIPFGMGGVQPVPATVINFMRQYPNKVR